ncbi:enoyl-CoA hydratase-related protein [Mesobacterium pallidum]|uniref:enoyl-CoA hydratase-related protein n=1 Tax=Mesobacterium pallidum TaxID=2872037 RepID=UPI001EE2F4CF|nr:enoyl-CoA hydratase-related protein [Mesobacterium pallidum]
MADPLLIDLSDGIATLTLNRPEALNALTGALRHQLVDTLASLDAREDVRVIVLTGTGRAFCAGLDVKELTASGRNVSENVDADIGAAITALKTPIIAAINGLAVTGGFEITLACDIVIAAESAWFCDSHAKIGLMAGWGLSQRLARTIGPSRAKDISLTARKVPASEARELGFVTRIVPDADLPAAARALAAEIAQWPRATTRQIKRQIDGGFGMTLTEGLAFERRESVAFNAGVTIGADKSGG